jgi:hypothetical protein
VGALHGVDAHFDFVPSSRRRLGRLQNRQLSDFTVPAVNAFAEQLRESGRSAEMDRRVVRSLGAIFREARRRGLSVVDPTAGLELDLPERDNPRPVVRDKKNVAQQ